MDKELSGHQDLLIQDLNNKKTELMNFKSKFKNEGEHKMINFSDNEKSQFPTGQKPISSKNSSILPDVLAVHPYSQAPITSKYSQISEK